MSGRHLFGELTKDFTPERRARVDARKAELRAAMPLHELRRARAMTQKTVGEVPKINQPAVAKQTKFDSSPHPTLPSNYYINVAGRGNHGAISMTKFTETSLPSAIQRLFELNQYEVRGPVQIHGAEIDLIATPKSDPFGTPIYIEATVQYVDNDKYGRDLGKLALVAAQEPVSRKVIVSSEGFSQPVAERALATGIETLTYDDLFKKFERFEPYISSNLGTSQLAAELRRLSEIYEEPDFSDAHGTEQATSFLTKWKDDDTKSGKWLLITGEYGTGKTALTKVLQFRWLEQYQNNPKLTLPLRIELREFARQFDARGLLHHFLDENRLSHISIDFVFSLIRNGRAVLILDGYDEMAQYLHTRERRSCLEALAQLSAGGAKGIITSRPNYFTETEELQMYEILYKSLEYGQYSLQSEAVELLKREEEIDHMLEQFIDRYERNLRDLSPQQTRMLIDRVLSEDEEGRNVVIALLNRIFRTTEDEEEISLSGKPVIVSYLLEVVEGLKEATGSGRIDSLTEWQIYKLIIDQLMIRDLRRSPEISPHERRSFLRKIAIYLSKREHPAITEEDFRDIVAHEFQRNIKVLPSDSQSSHVERLFADLRSSATLTRGGSGIHYGWRFSHNTIREYLVAEALIDGLDQEEFVADSIAVTDAMRIFASSTQEEKRKTLLSKLSRSWETISRGRGQLFTLLWDGFIRLYSKMENQRQLCVNRIAGNPPQMAEVVLSQIEISAEADPVSMPGADFNGAHLTQVSFCGADLTDANFQQTILEGVIFANCTLSKAKFDHALIIDANFSDSDLIRADFSEVEANSITIVAEANKHQGIRLISGPEALGYLSARGAITTELRPYFILQHHPAFWVVDKILRKLAKQSTRQRRGLEQRGAAHHDVDLAAEFVDYLEQCGFISTLKGRKDIVKATDRGRNVFLRYEGENDFAPELTQFFAERSSH